MIKIYTISPPECIELDVNLGQNNLLAQNKIANGLVYFGDKKSYVIVPYENIAFVCSAQENNLVTKTK